MNEYALYIMDQCTDDEIMEIVIHASMVLRMREQEGGGWVTDNDSEDRFSDKPPF